MERGHLFATLDNGVDGIFYDEKMVLVHNLLVDYEKENDVKYARLFERGYGSIE